jgi:haloacetate dehalogenase
MPLKVLWGREGVVARCYQPLDEWRRVADDVCGSAVPGGHYIPEEAPEALLAEAMSFFTVPSE